MINGYENYVQLKAGDVHYDGCIYVLAGTNKCYCAVATRNYGKKIDPWLDTYEIWGPPKLNEAEEPAIKIPNGWRLTFDDEVLTINHSRYSLDYQNYSPPWECMVLASGQIGKTREQLLKSGRITPARLFLTPIPAGTPEVEGWVWVGTNTPRHAGDVIAYTGGGIGITAEELNESLSATIVDPSHLGKTLLEIYPTHEEVTSGNYSLWRKVKASPPRNGIKPPRLAPNPNTVKPLPLP